MISGYRLMWLMVMFDLPVETRENRRDYRHFLENLEDDGFVRVQYSIYVRPCATDENTDVHYGRVVDSLPPQGEVRILKFTDKQWARMTVFFAAERIGTEEPPEQLLFFDEDMMPLIDESPEISHRLLAGKAEVPSPELAAQASSKAYAAEGRKPYGKRRKSTKNETPSFDFFD